ncbi:MAG: hypothetical protein LBJ14_07585 [Desulfarculales bacterium]|jgi:hypothetical protein|nr:hypothetical protein [Desulfarculales bacterium]
MMKIIVLLILSALLAFSGGGAPAPGPGRSVASPAPGPESSRLTGNGGILVASPAPEAEVPRLFSSSPLPAEDEALPPLSERETVEIKENFFLSQISDIYLNPDEYAGKIIKLEGMWFSAEEEGQTNAAVVRYGPGCCLNDALAGFEVVWGEKNPQNEAWVEACGLLEKYRLEDDEYLRLRLSSLRILERRGKETVWR